MMKSKLILRQVIPALLTAGLFLSSAADGALTLNVTTFNSTTLSFNVSGTLDESTGGALFPGLFTIAPDEFCSTAFYTGTPVLLSNSISIGGVNTIASMYDNGYISGYSAYFFDQFDVAVPAGTEIVGSATFTGNFTSQPTLSLWSGYDDNRNLARFETTAIPEVSSSLFCGLGMLGLLRRRR